MIFRIFIYFIFIFLLLGCSYMEETSKPSQQKVIMCQKNSDCTIVKKGPCSCRAGGENMAIPKNKVKFYLSKIPKGKYCAAVMSNHWSCASNTNAVCRKGHCKLEQF